ncbi:MAG: hypothetical protein WAK29_14960 [Terriglobales bacterium]
MTTKAIFLAAAIVAATLFATSPAASQSSPAALQNQIYAALSGLWTGQLEYRDFESDKRVLLPTWLEVKPAPDGRSLQFVYTYDDGPAKIVTEQSTVAIDPAAHRFTMTSDRDHSTDTYQITGLDSLQAGRGQFTLTGTGAENGKPVDVRILVTIKRNLYQFRKETRLPGQEFNFRDGYTLTRRNP